LNTADELKIKKLKIKKTISNAAISFDFLIFT